VVGVDRAKGRWKHWEWFLNHWNRIASGTSVKPIARPEDRKIYYHKYWVPNPELQENALALLDGLLACPFWLGEAKPEMYKNYEFRGLHFKGLFTKEPTTQQPLWKLLATRHRHYQFTSTLEERIIIALRASTYEIDPNFGGSHGDEEGSLHLPTVEDLSRYFQPHELPVALEIFEHMKRQAEENPPPPEPTPRQILARHLKQLKSHDWIDIAYAIKDLTTLLIQDAIPLPITPKQINDLLTQRFAAHPHARVRSSVAVWSRAYGLCLDPASIPSAKPPINCPDPNLPSPAEPAT
jgi:hypothetical protein